MHSLPLFVRLADRPVILIGEGEGAQAKRRLLERAGARIVAESEAAALAIVAVEDDAEALAAVDRLRARGILVNATDRPDLCDFTMPAIVDRDPVLVAVATGGASAGLAKAVRQRIEALLPPGLGALAGALAGARDGMRARWPDPAARRRALDAALAPGGALDPLTGPDGDDVARWLENPGDIAQDRFVPLRLASPDPDDLTLRTARLLGEADIVYHHPSVPAAILDRSRADAVRISAPAAPDAPGRGLTLWLEMET
jgi:uroporphyrin-III C-methyltransferase/precorrin-2 dehydrogenase/sirohydrochlorin ferrochelatase